MSQVAPADRCVWSTFSEQLGLLRNRILDRAGSPPRAVDRVASHVVVVFRRRVTVDACNRVPVSGHRCTGPFSVLGGGIARSLGLVQAVWLHGGRANKYTYVCPMTMAGVKLASCEQEKRIEVTEPLHTLTPTNFAIGLGSQVMHTKHPARVHGRVKNVFGMRTFGTGLFVSRTPCCVRAPRAPLVLRLAVIPLGVPLGPGAAWCTGAYLGRGATFFFLLVCWSAM